MEPERPSAEIVAEKVDEKTSATEVTGKVEGLLDLSKFAYDPSAKPSSQKSAQPIATGGGTSQKTNEVPSSVIIPVVPGATTAKEEEEEEKKKKKSEVIKDPMIVEADRVLSRTIRTLEYSMGGRSVIGLVLTENTKKANTVTVNRIMVCLRGKKITLTKVGVELLVVEVGFLRDVMTRIDYEVHLLTVDEMRRRLNELMQQGPEDALYQQPISDREITFASSNRMAQPFNFLRMQDADAMWALEVRERGLTNRGIEFTPSRKHELFRAAVTKLANAVVATQGVATS